MKSRLTIKGALGLLAALAGAAWLMLGAPSSAPAQSSPQKPAATEQIDVEHAIAFPYDI
jgi:hypothetical protein